MNTTINTTATAAICIVCVVLSGALAQTVPGIPEPGLILYGQLRNASTGPNLLTYGTLRWTIQPPSGSPIAVGVTLTNINDQFSYVVCVPFETVLAGFTLSANTLALSNTPVNYTRSATVNFQPATILGPAIGTFTFGAADRGRVERVDLQVSLAFVDTDGDGLDDNWELAYFGNLSQSGTGDFDDDGMSNFAEYKAGTNPKDAQSLFEFVDIRPDPLGGIAVRWSSVALTTYSVLRSSDLLTGFVPLQTNIPATPGTNTFQDLTATGVGPYFYRIRVD